MTSPTDSSAACPQCGAHHARAGDSCASRFAELLALDHSRQAPWGPLHGLAFAAYALQHPAEHAASLERCWLMAYRVTVAGDDPSRLASAMRRTSDVTLATFDAPPLPQGPAPTHFAITIADLGEFAAEDYPVRCRSWARAAVDAWRTRR
ncbi:MAG: hypothetical protein HY084_06100 [Gemmatimonadetes bacterium]|nr:hypothetical protein [Gemmatimonadota bacterium]